MQLRDIPSVSKSKLTLLNSLPNKKCDIFFYDSEWKVVTQLERRNTRHDAGVFDAGTTLPRNGGSAAPLAENCYDSLNDHEKGVMRNNIAAVLI